jgi:integrase
MDFRSSVREQESAQFEAEFTPAEQGIDPGSSSQSTEGTRAGAEHAFSPSVRSEARDGLTPRRVSVAKRPGIYYRENAKGLRRYEISFTDSAGRRRWKTIDGNLGDAERALRDVQVRMDRGERVIANRKTLAEVATEWLVGQTELRPRTLERYRTALEAHILPRLGHKKVAAITPEDVVALLQDMKAGAYYTRDNDGELVRRLRKKPAAGATLQATLRPLSRILDDCDGVAGNAVKRLKKGQRPRLSKRAKRVFSSDELRRLLACTTPRYRVLLATAAYTGLRQSELLGLLWREVDFEAGYLRVRKQLDRDGRRVPPKTEQAVREVALAPKLALLLREHRVASPRSSDDDFVFVNEAGQPFDHHNVRQRGFDRAARLAKLNEGQSRKATFHDLRRTYGSMLIAAGADIAHVSRQMGHANPSITLAIYTDEFNARENAERTRATLDAAIGTSLETVGSERRRNGAVKPDTALLGNQSTTRFKRPAATGSD